MELLLYLNRNGCSAIIGIYAHLMMANTVENRLSSRYVVFEFKNYTEEVGQGQVLTTEKYLLPLAFRSLAIILSRKGANNSASKSTEGAMRESGKLILILDDDHLHKMLEMKDVGGDPSDVLLDLADEFLTGLGR